MDESSTTDAKVVQPAEGAPRQWAVGDRLIHETFGRGRVLQIRGVNGSRTLDIKFDQHGAKELQLMFAGKHLTPDTNPPPPEAEKPAPGPIQMPTPANSPAASTTTPAAAAPAPAKPTPEVGKRIPLTAEEKSALELRLLRERSERMRDFGRAIAQRKSAESTMQSELNEHRERTKEMMGEMMDLARTDIDLVTAMSRQEKIEFPKKDPAAAAPASSAPTAAKDSNVIAKPDPEADYKLGAAAAKAGKFEDTCPFEKELTPGKRQAWFAGYFDEIRIVKEAKPAITHGITEEKLTAAVSALIPGKVSKVVTVALYENQLQAYVLGTFKRGEITNWYLQTLCTPEEWQTLYQEKYGRAIEQADQSAEAKNQRIAGGADCGRVTRVGKGVGKKFIVCPRSALLVVTTGEKTTNKVIPEKDSKQRAAGD